MIERITAEHLLWMDKATVEERKYAADINFIAFFSYYFLHYVKAAFADYHYQMAGDLDDLVSGKIQELGWFMYRESAKTSLAKGFAIYCILYKKFEYINVDSYDKANAERFLFDVVVELQTNQKIKADFGEVFNSKRSTDEKTQKRVSDFLTTNGVRVEAHSTQESVRGRLHGSIRPQLIIMDDFETMATIRSEAATRQVKDHIAEFKGGLDQQKGRILYLGNYLSESGTVQMVMDKAGIDPQTRVRTVWLLDDLGNPTWPEKYVLTDAQANATGKISVESIERRMRTVDGGNTDFNREMLGKTFDPSKAKFRKEMFRPVSRDEVDKMSTVAYLFIDPPGQSYNDKTIQQAEDDFIGWSLVKVNSQGRWMVKSWRKRQTPREMINQMFSLWSSESLQSIGIEDTQFYQGLKTLLEDEQRTRKIWLNIVEVNHKTKRSKKERILTLLPRYEGGTIWHIQGECNDLEEELLRFPISDYDDASDSLAMATEIVERPPEDIQPEVPFKAPSYD